jgi:hypothetical protein
LHNIQRAFPQVRLQHAGIDARQIVDWKSPDVQLNPYGTLRAHRKIASADPFVQLRGIYPDSHLDEMRMHYEQVREEVLVAA